MTDKDELFKGIEDAANNLFSQYIVKKPGDGEAAAPPEEAEQPQATPEPELDLTTEAAAPPPEPEPAPEPEPQPEPPPTPEPEAPLVPELELSPEPEPPPAAPPEASAAPPPPPEQPPAPEPAEDFVLELETEETAPPVDVGQIFAEMEESLLTIDWEVNSDNITKARTILGKLISSQGWTAATPIGQVAEQMDTVLTSMLKSPGNSPVSAPSQLKNAMQAIRDTHEKGGPPDTETRKKLSTALSNLHAVITPDTGAGDDITLDVGDDFQAALSVEAPPQPATPEASPGPVAATPVQSAAEPALDTSLDLGLELDLDVGSDRSAPGERVPESTAKALKSYAKTTAESIKMVTPVEKLFSTKPGMTKLHVAVKQLREKLTGQQELLVGAFSSDYLSYSGFGSVNGWLESQLDALNGCIKRISKLEKLFSKTKGYEKLYRLSKKIRTALEKSHDAITVVVGGAPILHQFDLTGEYPAIISPSGVQEPEAPAAAVSAVSDPEEIIDKCIALAKSIENGTASSPSATSGKIRQALEKVRPSISGASIIAPGAAAAALSAAAGSSHCQWDWLLKTTWGGQLVGLAPEQVAFESKSPVSVKAFRDMAYFKLNKLKSMPWTNLQNLFSGDLSELDKSTLKNMELEIAQPPPTFVGSSKKKAYLVIMYISGKGKIFLLDSPTEAISVAEEALWSPGTSESDIAGTLTVYGSTLPVVSIV
ncbi:MAG: hypothetical protein ABFQ82_01525 [Thermodesulfobacteriota bacterium]